MTLNLAARSAAETYKWVQWAFIFFSPQPGSNRVSTREAQAFQNFKFVFRGFWSSDTPATSSMGAFPNLEWEFRPVCSVQGFWGFGGSGAQRAGGRAENISARLSEEVTVDRILG